MKLKFLLLVSISLLSFSCSENPEHYIKYLDGYWEIKHVEKDNQLVKEYTVNTNVDYFKINTENLTGFRKKVTPTLEGKYIVTQHESPFTLKIENHKLIIYYTINDVEFKETIVSASSEKLVITNEQGFTYVYRPFKALNIKE